ncbi:MAG: phage major capsid protein [Anaerolineae bacterium]|nr:phage major capsid protein [Anaerolineae bacterium]
MTLQERLNALLAKANALKSEYDGKTIPAEKREELRGWMDEAKDLKVQIEAERELEALNAYNSAGTGRKSSPAPSAEKRSEPATPKSHEPIFRSFGEQLMAIKAAGIPGNTPDPRLFAVVDEKASGLNEAVDSEGGFLIEPDRSKEIFREVHATGEIMSRVKAWPVSGNGVKIPAVDEKSRATGSRMGGVTAYYAVEAGTVTATKPGFRTINLELNKLMTLGYATEEMLADAPFLGAFMQDAFIEEIRFTAEDAFINGNGNGKPLGILNAPALVTVAKETDQAADTLLTANIEKMWSRMYAPSRKSAIWIYNQDVEPQLMGLVRNSTVGSIPLFMPPGGLSATPYSTIFGRPAIAVEYCQTLGDKGDILFVDFSRYWTISKQMQASSSIHVRFVYDEQTFKVTYRHDGQPAWYSALTPKNGSNTLSPYVALAAR